MFLKSIEVHGFKSFANKILFEFNDGITGIVGPNGSGKSNVADAVRWVLGEQSAKQLRGSSMQDIIFAGTQTRKPQGYASVAITFDNADHALAIDYDEVTVTRRVYRSGESEYLMNGSICRLKDINELFYDTGIGKEGYSIIGQGQIDKILSNKPEDRRELFDEAAGIVKFKKRKNTAVKKLTAEQANLTRVADILNTLERRVGPLEKQAEKAKEYLKLRDQLKALDLQSFRLESGQAQKRIREAASNMEVVSADLASQKEKNDALKLQYDEKAEEIEKLEEVLESGRTRKAEALVQAESMEGQIHVLEEQIHTEEASEAHIRGRLDSVRADLKDREERRTSIGEEKALLADELKKLDKTQQNFQKQTTDCDDQIAFLDSEITSTREGMMEAMNDQASIGARKQHFATLLQQNHVRRSELTQKILNIKADEASQKEAMEQLMGTIDILKDRIDGKEEAYTARQEKRTQIQRQRAMVSKEINEKQQEFQSVRTKLESLRNLSERYEGYGNSIRRVMEQKQYHPGIIGVVADLIETQKTYETAIETALGGSIQNIVTSNEDTAKNMIAYLKKNQYGRATFLPLTAISGRGGFQKPEALKEEGVIGLADKLVKVKGGYKNLAEYLLGRILVVDQIDHAIKIAKKYQYSLRIVTLDGELLNAGGSMTGGAFKNSSNLLGRRRELEELDKRLKQNRTQFDALKNQENALELDGNRIQKEIENDRQVLQDWKVKLSSLETNHKALTERAEEIHTSYQEAQDEMAALILKEEEIKDGEAALKEESKDLDSRSKEAEQLISELEAQIAGERQKKESLHSSLLKAQLDYSAADQKNAFLEENLARIEAEITAFETELTELEAQIAGCHANIDEKRAEIETVREEIEGLGLLAEKLDQEIKDAQSRRESCMKQQKGFFERSEELSAAVNRLEKEMMRLENQKEKAEEALEHLVSYIWEEYETTPSEAEQMPLTEGITLTSIRRDTTELKQSIKALGPVNVNAIEEYKEVSEEYYFKKGQYDDLKKAEESLMGIIRDLDEGMRRQFEENFKHIKSEFDKVFKEMFGGGQGTLELVDGEDMLEAGIEINAQPPGKKLQNMMQLSGGEKALTAISLLFAIQNLKPSPFCLLDEIEAALDDSNVGRYADYLAKLKKNTQFIVITHRRGTMLIADRLYGITMQEKGVSTLVSVDLTDQPV